MVHIPLLPIMNDERLFFGFGMNWASYSSGLNETRIKQAQESLEILFGESALRSATFLDIGCGSGLFSIAAANLNTQKVVGIDIDPIAIQVSKNNAAKWLKNPANITFQQCSVLNEKAMITLGLFDIVYAWGSLHHTGSMYQAIDLAAQRVKTGGQFVIAIYNKHITSRIWWVIKWLYNKIPAFLQTAMVWSFVPVITSAKWIVTRKNPFKMRRGMDFMHNVVDWLGGIPYEYASVSEMTSYLKSLGIVIERVIPAQVPTGCNEYVCRMK